MQAPSVGVQDEPTYCLRVNTEWISYLQGMLKRGEVAGFWDDDTDEDGREGIRTIQDLLADTPCEDVMTLKREIVIAQHHEAQNVSGGATIAATPTALFLTRIFRDDTGLATLSSNNLQLPEGVWRVRARHVIRQATLHLSRLALAWIDAPSGSAITEWSMNERHSGDGYTMPEVSTLIEVDGTTTITWAYYSSAAQGVNGLGVPLNVSGMVEIYGEMVCERITLNP